jgi:hypothetical protein
MASHPCDLFISDHDSGTCRLDPRHDAALRRRRAGAPEWSPLVRGRDGGGRRDFLDGEPITCGSGLVLQGMRNEADDYGEFSLRTEEGFPVRYEVDARGGVVLYAGIGGHEFTTGLEPWMRFRRPVRR